MLEFLETAHQAVQAVIDDPVLESGSGSGPARTGTVTWAGKNASSRAWPPASRATKRGGTDRAQSGETGQEQAPGRMRMRRMLYIQTSGIDTPERLYAPFILGMTARAMDMDAGIFFMIRG